MALQGIAFVVCETELPIWLKRTRTKLPTIQGGPLNRATSGFAVGVTASTPLSRRVRHHETVHGVGGRLVRGVLDNDFDVVGALGLAESPVEDIGLAEVPHDCNGPASGPTQNRYSCAPGAVSCTVAVQVMTVPTGWGPAGDGDRVTEIEA